MSNVLLGAELFVTPRPVALSQPSKPRRLLRLFLQNALLFPFLRHFCDSFSIQGLENVQRLKSPCVFVANHSSHADVAIILLALPPRHRSHLAIAAAADYFYKDKILGRLVTLLLNTFPFERNRPRQGLEVGKQILQSGQSLLIFPEGTRSNPEAKPGFKRGFAALSCQLGLPVVPIHIDGSYEMLPKGSLWPQRAAVQISFGEPIYPSGESSSELAHMVENKVQELSFVA